MEPTLVVVGLTCRQAPIEVRERFWISEKRRSQALATLARAEGIEEAVAFSTCQRTEFVIWGDPTLAVNSVLRFLSAEYDLRLSEWKNFHRLLDQPALTYTCRVGSGLDSLVLAETEIAEAVNTAWQQGRESGSVGPNLDRVFEHALLARRRVRRETRMASLLLPSPQAAVNMANTLLGSLTGRKVILFGLATVNEAALQSLRDCGASSLCLLGGGSNIPAELVQRFQIKVSPIEQRRARLAEADLIVCAGPVSAFGRRRRDFAEVAADRGERALVVIDLGLPRTVDPSIGEIPAISLYNQDDLQRAVSPGEAGNEDRTAAEAIVEEEVQALKEELTSGRKVSAWTDLRHELDRICREELDSFRREQGPFAKDQDQLLAAVGRRITHRIAGSLVRGLPKRREVRHLTVPT